MSKISVEHSCQIRALYQISYTTGINLLQMFLQYSKVQIYVHAKKSVNGEPDHCKLNKGSPRKFSAHDERTIPKLRKDAESFTSRRLQLDPGRSHVSNWTFQRHLNYGSYQYLQSQN